MLRAVRRRFALPAIGRGADALSSARAPGRRHLRLGVLVSGGGRTLQYLSEASRGGELDGEVVRCIASASDCYALERARSLGVPATHLSRKAFPSATEFANAIFDDLDQHRVDLALLAGYLVKLPLVERWRGRVLNIHPALLPAFGGKGFYGHHVHEAVRRAGVKLTGCTVHFVDDEYDHGPILIQRAVPVRFEDDADAIANRVFEQERIAYIAAVNAIARGQVVIDDHRVRELGDPT